LLPLLIVALKLASSHRTSEKEEEEEEEEEGELYYRQQHTVTIPHHLIPSLPLNHSLTSRFIFRFIFAPPRCYIYIPPPFTIYLIRLLARSIPNRHCTCKYSSIGISLSAGLFSPPPPPAPPPATPVRTAVAIAAASWARRKDSAK
jgi:hypothetical protein